MYLSVSVAARRGPPHQSPNKGHNNQQQNTVPAADVIIFGFGFVVVADGQLPVCNRTLPANDDRNRSSHSKGSIPDRRVMVAKATAEALTEALWAAMVEIVEQTNDAVVEAHARPSGADAARIVGGSLDLQTLARAAETAARLLRDAGP